MKDGDPGDVGPLSRNEVFKRVRLVVERAHAARHSEWALKFIEDIRLFMLEDK